MTKKDYELIAKAVLRARMNELASDMQPEGWPASAGNTDYLAETLATDLEQANTKFNRSKFLKACGLEA